MADQITIFVAVDDVHPQTLQQALPADDAAAISGMIELPGESWRAVEDAESDVLVVACNGGSTSALALVDEATMARPSRPVVVLCEGATEAFVRRAFEAGADDVVPIPESSQAVLFTLEKAVARKRRSSTAAGAALAPLVCVLGPKGGAGKTLVATNMAVALADAGQRVVLVDLDLQFGDVGLTLGLAPEKTIFDLARSSGTLDADKIEGYLEHHESGARVLLAPSRPDQGSAVGADFLRDLYAALRKTNDVVIIDTGPGFTPEAIASIDSSSDVVMVGMLDALSLKSTKLGLETLELMGYDPARVQLVLNRADSRVGITEDDVTAVLGRKPDALVPSDREIPRSLSESRAIVTAKRGSDAAQALRGLAEQYQARRYGNRSVSSRTEKSRRGRLRRAA